jgi:cold shock CspA family protein
MENTEGRLTRIGIFYDGNFFFHVSNYYQYHHERRARISVAGLHNFIRDEVARRESSDARYCQIVDAHYFRGRFRAVEADNRDLLLRERIFDDVLLQEGVTTHYLPLGREGEKGIDVWLSLEMFELAIYKRFNVSVLIACDGDFQPLVRKLNTLGTRVMVLGWDFKYVDQNGNERETRTAQVLLDEVTYPVMMPPIIDDRARKSDPLINGLFVPRKEFAIRSVPTPNAQTDAADKQGATKGIIHSLKSGYGFIQPDSGGSTLFFFYTDVLNAEFDDLKPGEHVEFTIGQNEKGPCAKQIRVVQT